MLFCQHVNRKISPCVFLFCFEAQTTGWALGAKGEPCSLIPHSSTAAQQVISKAIKRNALVPWQSPQLQHPIVAGEQEGAIHPRRQGVRQTTPTPGTCQPAVPSTAVGGFNLTTLFFDVPPPHDYVSRRRHSDYYAGQGTIALSQRARTRPVTTTAQLEDDNKPSKPWIPVFHLCPQLFPFGSVLLFCGLQSEKERSRQRPASRIAHEAAALTAKAAAAAAAAVLLRWPAQRSCASPTSCRSQQVKCNMLKDLEVFETQWACCKPTSRFLQYGRMQKLSSTAAKLSARPCGLPPSRAG